MKELRVISNDCLPTRLPIVGTIVWWLLLERIDAPGWAWGAVGVLVAVLWIAVVVRIYYEKRCKVPGFGDGQ